MAFYTSEAFGVKEIKFGGFEQTYIDRFSNSQKLQLRTKQLYKLYKLPRFAIEAVAFGGILLIVLYLMSRSGTFSDVVPVIVLMFLLVID